jgi:CHC2 zinc finger
MIDRSALPSIPGILARMDIQPGRHRRARCPIHRGENPQAFSWTDVGQWYCFRCGLGGDPIKLVELALDLDFRGALRWLGIDPTGPVPQPDPAILRREKIRAGLCRWADSRGRELRVERYVRGRVIAAAERRLNRNQEDEWGWSWLRWAYTGLESIEYELEMLEAGEAEQLDVYRHRRAA